MGAGRGWRIGNLAAASVVCLGAAAESGEALAPRSWVLENALSISIFIVVACALVWCVVIVRKRMAERVAEEDNAARTLEAQVMSLVAGRRAVSSTEAPSRSPAAESVAADAGAVSSPASPTTGGPLVGTEGAAPSGQTVEAILTRLRAGSLLEGIEGTLFLSDGQTEGKIIRLRGGKTAVVLPRMESAEFLARQIKRFDLCIVALGGDQTCVINPLGAYIADHVAL